MPFSHLPAPFQEALTARGYEAPTPVQAAVLEPEVAVPIAEPIKATGTVIHEESSED